MQLLDNDDLTDRGIRPKSRAQRWRLIREGKFPRPLKIGSRNLWTAESIDEFVAARVAESRQQVAA